MDANQTSGLSVMVTARPRTTQSGDEAAEESASPSTKRQRVEERANCSASAGRWSDLAADCLRLVLDFLTIHELGTRVVPTCRQWRKALEVIGALRNDVGLRSMEKVEGLLQSPIRRHINDLELDPDDDFSSRVSVSPLLLDQIRQRMPHLARFTCAISCEGRDESEGERPPWNFPPALKTLSVRLFSEEGFTYYKDENMPEDDPEWQRAEAVMQAVGRLSGLRSLRLILPGGPFHWLEPLTRLKESLESLTIELACHAEIEISSRTIEIFRSLTHLECLDIPIEWQSEDLVRLTAEPTLRLQNIGSNHLIVNDEETSAAVSRLPALTKLFLTCEYRDPSFLRRFDRLVSLRLSCRRVVDIPLLVPALAHCTSLEELDLSHPCMTSAPLCALLSSLPNLASLTLRYCGDLESLAFSSTLPHLSRTLKDLVVAECPSLPQSELVHLRSLLCLEDLRISRSFQPLLDAESDLLRSLRPSLHRLTE